MELVNPIKYAAEVTGGPEAALAVILCLTLSMFYALAYVHISLIMHLNVALDWPLTRIYTRKPTVIPNLYVTHHLLLVLKLFASKFPAQVLVATFQDKSIPEAHLLYCHRLLFTLDQLWTCMFSFYNLNLFQNAIIWIANISTFCLYRKCCTLLPVSW